MEVVVLADEFISGREVEDNLCSTECKLAAWWDRSPNVFAELYTETALASLEYHVTAHWHSLGTEVNLCVRHCECRSKPALLVELLIVREEGLRHNTENLAALDYHGTVVECRLHLNRHTYDSDDGE